MLNFDDRKLKYREQKFQVACYTVFHIESSNKIHFRYIRMIDCIGISIWQMRRKSHHTLNKNTRHFKNHLCFSINLKYMAYKSITESNDISNIASSAKSTFRGKHHTKFFIWNDLKYILLGYNIRNKITMIFLFWNWKRIYFLLNRIILSYK